MAAYLVYICQSVLDREELETYWKESPATLDGHEYKLLAVYTPFERLEGEGEVLGVVLAEFPSAEAAKSWFNCTEYSRVRKHRQRGAKYLGLLVEGGIQGSFDKRPGGAHALKE
jgi:uncharacterized protein (DUF1330 family)